ncbi:homocysteine-responsive endoplasmic reticulum-resident ubiquitin-like domain member 2 protein [Argiope bruennichi]|uniref:Homocysteine-responsive endoplasmic like protein n=1 Tax=Argiope bruennichi TaxID=94029 RepID=A0A8T0E9S8_ARGBR|nr:homocysteine-responsive endoplasmic reticulum-resident ubiquitin-like domain member 2 protein [Argiope bruennichi]XP_055936925.1 homocysteine-responsive endoplasmic reticulum-resident ubiquitin-like domain member 2 protein [Argiope bruennichi]KAF8768198.1 Homocysteine-responsive endoplasmic like protein [Argiope bruennichi]
MEIQLIIKAPNQNVDDYIVNCNLDWTVEQLKNHLSQSYPSKPEVGQQKLIYSGRFLHDHLQLKDILRHDDDQYSIHIFHLVCKSDSTTTCIQHSKSSQKRYNQPSSSCSSNEVTAGQSSENALRHRNVNPMSHVNSFYPQLPTVLPPSAMSGFVPDSQASAQIAAMQQMYAYYLSQYMQSMNIGSMPGNNVDLPNLVNFQQPPNTNEPVAPSPPPPPPRPINQRNNIQGPLLMDENDEGVRRDWLEHAFVLLRFLILFCIVYFYSTPERLMIVMVGTIVIFLYHEGWFVRRGNPAAAPELYVPQGPINNLDVPNNEIENNGNEHPLVNQNVGANLEVHNEHELEAAMDGEEPPHAQNPDVVNNNHIFSPLTFLQIFLSSLIPDPPPPVNIN